MQSGEAAVALDHALHAQQGGGGEVAHHGVLMSMTKL
jgi:hypothetical protein